MKNYKMLMFLVAPFFLASNDVEEVIVTANKKAETLQEIPMNISVITEATLDERGITNPEDYLRSIAGVSTPGGSNYYTFRGLNTSTSQRSSGTSSTYIDEVSGSLLINQIVQRLMEKLEWVLEIRLKLKILRQV
jgi:outer membrane receptor protein involved in Fe transport